MHAYTYTKCTRLFLSFPTCPQKAKPAKLASVFAGKTRATRLSSPTDSSGGIPMDLRRSARVRIPKVLKDHDSDVPEEDYDDSGNEVADPDSDFELVRVYVYAYVYVHVCVYVAKDLDSDVPEEDLYDDSGNEVADSDSDFELVRVYVCVLCMYV